MQDKIKSCLKEGEQGERHKGLRKTIPDDKITRGHVNKAIHNFNAIETFNREGYSDWSASAAFFCLYHALLALIAKKGYESRNQTCTFALVEDMISNKEISLTLEELKEIYDKDVTEKLEQSIKILDMRETMQYSIRTSLKDAEFKILKDRTKFLLDKIRNDIEKI